MTTEEIRIIAIQLAVEYAKAHEGADVLACAEAMEKYIRTGKVDE